MVMGQSIWEGGYEQPTTPSIWEDEQVAPGAGFLNLEGLVNPLRGEVRSWFSGQGRVKGGRPQTFEEENFIIDYMDKFGVPPTAEMVSGWASRQDREQFHFTPESTMGRKGFATPGGDRFEELFGPRVGADVPQGGLIITDESGNPLTRTFRPDQYRGQIEKGQFLQPPESYLSGLTGGYPAGEGVYPEFTAQRPTPVRPTTVEELGLYSPQKIYGLRLYDYLQAQVIQDAPKVAELEERHDAGVITDEGYRTSLRYLMSEERASEIIAEAEAGVAQGIMPEELPFYLESKDVIGEATRGLLESSFDQYDPRTGELIPGLWEQKQGLVGAPTMTSGQPPSFKGYGGEPETRTANPSQEFAVYVENLGLAQPSIRYLQERYNMYLRLWQASGQPDFIGWLQGYLASGGQ